MEKHPFSTLKVSVNCYLKHKKAKKNLKYRLWLFANVTANVCGFYETKFYVFKKLNYICTIKIR